PQSARARRYLRSANGASGCLQIVAWPYGGSDNGLLCVSALAAGGGGSGVFSRLPGNAAHARPAVVSCGGGDDGDFFSCGAIVEGVFRSLHVIASARQCAARCAAGQTDREPSLL